MQGRRVQGRCRLPARRGASLRHSRLSGVLRGNNAHVIFVRFSWSWDTLSSSNRAGRGLEGCFPGEDADRIDRAPLEHSTNRVLVSGARFGRAAVGAARSSGLERPRGRMAGGCARTLGVGSHFRGPSRIQVCAWRVLEEMILDPVCRLSVSSSARGVRRS
jgi:hypothetical protein